MVWPEKTSIRSRRSQGLPGSAELRASETDPNISQPVPELGYAQAGRDREHGRQAFGRAIQTPLEQVGHGHIYPG